MMKSNAINNGLRHLLPLAIFTVVISGFRGADAQVVFQRAAPFGQAGDPEEMQKKKFEDDLNARIDEVDRICDLDEAQVKKLQTGAKGAVSRAMAEWKKQAKAMEKQIGGQIRIPNNLKRLNPAKDEDEDEDEQAPDDADDADDEEDKPKDDPAKANVLRMIAPMVGGSMSPERQKIWINTLAATLTDSQREKLVEVEKDRLEFRRRVAVQNKVGELDRELRLSPDQRQQAIEMVDRILGKTFEIETVSGPGVMVYGDVAQLLPKHMEEILTPMQLESFRKTVKDANNPMLFAQRNFALMQRRMMVRLPGMEKGKAFFGAAFRGGVGMDAKQVKIDQVVPEGPAEKAGLCAGDVLLNFDGNKLSSAAGFLMTIGRLKPGKEITVAFERDGEEKSVTVKLGERE